LRLDSHVCFSPHHPPEHLEPILRRNRFDGAILAIDSPALPATGPHIAAILVRPSGLVQSDPRVRGVHAPIAEVTLDLAHSLSRRFLPLDLEMSPADFPELLDLTARAPDLRIVIDHLARPQYSRSVMEDWLRGMQSAARLPNVFCKISGLLTEAQLPWTSAPIRPFVQHALAIFGPSRLMFGSEWPVRLPDITWKESLAAFTQSIGAQSIGVREQLLGGTAAAFYRIPA